MKKFDIFRVITIVLMLIAIIGLFLPYEKSIGNHRIKLQSNPDAMYMQEVKITNKDAIDISIVENLKVYCYGMNDNSGVLWMKGECVINFVITITMIVSIVLIFLFVLLKKDLVVIIFDILLALSSLAMNFDIIDRGVIPSNKYTYGISYYLYGIIAVAILICSIVSIVKKKKLKKQNNI